MNYTTGTGELQHWLVAEDGFCQDWLGKGESVFSLGNGYMGLRSVTEEHYANETRNLFVAGTFNKFAENEVTELPNAADVLWMEFKLNGTRFDLTQGKIHSYRRTLNLKQAELTRDVTWESPTGEMYRLVFSRFVSMANLHVIAQRVTITPEQATTIALTSGINGQTTNSGVQHFLEGDKRLYDGRFMQQLQKTTESAIDFAFHSVHRFATENVFEPKSIIKMDRRKIFFDYSDISLSAGETLTIEKYSTVFTSRDRDVETTNLAAHALEVTKNIEKLGYNRLLADHVKAWDDLVWSHVPIKIESEEMFDQLAIRFAQYHMAVMTPKHDNRMNIGAKGLSGEGYKGHTFWDTEIFILPYYTYTNPKIARSLLEYRYQSLAGAHRKAQENGYEGAMFPWESAWLDDGEVTPVWGAADIVTGEATKIWSGFIEQHITSDIAFATWQYYQVTGDQDFMDQYGYELLIDTAKFWASRLEWNEAAGRYEINEVVGPDEYKEHVDNNAFTNYTAHWNIQKAIEYIVLLRDEKSELFDRLNEKLDLETAEERFRHVLDLIYLPQIREDGVLPQDDTYLDKEIIDLTKYKNQENVGSMFLDYNLEQVNEIQVSKQADVMILMYLLEDLFSADVKRANWEYYEPKTLHDSSLSLSTHSVLASDLGDQELAYDLFRRASEIDLGPNMKTSDAGIHAASLGGIWQAVVNGFGGVRMTGGKLRVSPMLPKAWTSLTFSIEWQGETLDVYATQQDVTISRRATFEQPITVEVYGEERSITDTFTSEVLSV
ncbi:glycosyl hydrolase family 65 protein [Exiguobacterium sp.]|uniref:glycoside hydrolase family 65 protein n=1 Tax=Exiguobacterium sp. TaxID=44751 RepID=UPI00263A7CF2|nr:glycosyl hydrolase family 65 protein [Exiguobacterium sp.]MCC5891194.1 glycoside hydrolase family 65 protein [Exiguobacterium sp.]